MPDQQCTELQTYRYNEETWPMNFEYFACDWHSHLHFRMGWGDNAWGKGVGWRSWVSIGFWQHAVGLCWHGGRFVWGHTFLAWVRYFTLGCAWWGTLMVIEAGGRAMYAACPPSPDCSSPIYILMQQCWPGSLGGTPSPSLCALSLSSTASTDLYTYTSNMDLWRF